MTDINVNTKKTNLKVSRLFEYTRKEVEKTIEELNKKADKLKVGRPTVILGETYIFYFVNDGGEYHVDVFDLEIKMPESMKIQGWEPIAFLDHTDGVSIQLDIDADYDYNFDAALTDRHCEHCNTERYRRKSWVLQNENGEFKKIGSTCVKDFTGVSPEKFFKLFQLISKTIQICYDEDSKSSYSFHRNPENYVVYDIDKIWSIAKNVIDVDDKYIKSEYKYVEVSKYRQDKVRSNQGESTYDKVYELLSKSTDVEINTELVEGMKKWLSEMVVRIESQLREDYKRDANGEYVYDENGQGLFETKLVECENEYDAKLKSFADKKRTRRFEIGFLSYMVEAYTQHLIRLATPESNHVGVVGEKTELELTVSMIRSISNDFGVSHIYKMLDDKGNVFTKFGTINDRFIVDDSENVVVGSKLKFNAEVKAHNEYKGNKETVLGRVSNVAKPKKSKKVKV